ncbi:MAG: prepilin-type N-terminal cleavage/methylation domain-containing protein [bacterium]|nr:prepilin-type N-terminal cleavage/methylation domain-containing protein [bacterium]
MRRFGRSRALARAGFTLIEMLAVLVIISILAVFVLRTLMTGEDIVRMEATRGFIRQVATMVEEHEVERGDYPPSTFPSQMDPKPTKTNMGAEMLFITLYPADSSKWRAREVPDENRGNVDGDTTKKSATMYTKADAFEIIDGWENPIAYIHRRDYEKPVTYVTIDPLTGIEHEAMVKGVVNPETGDPYNKQTFQLISAGPDGIFGTDDDIGNW